MHCIILHCKILSMDICDLYIQLKEGAARIFKQKNHKNLQVFNMMLKDFVSQDILFQNTTLLQFQEYLSYFFFIKACLSIQNVP